MFDDIERRFRALAPAVESCTLRIERRREERLEVERDTPGPRRAGESFGGMVTVRHRGGLGYAATSDLSETGLAAAIGRAVDLAALSAQRMVPGFPEPAPLTAEAAYFGPEQRPWAEIRLGDRMAMLMDASRRLRIDERIADWGASFWSIDKEQLFLDAAGGRIAQRFHYLMPFLWASASAQGETQRRSFGDAGMRVGGAEVLDQLDFAAAPDRIARDAIDLLEAPNCPEGRMDLVLSPDQMVLQIHESIGHPLELDRILGDERNYAGTSFVTPDMFGTYRYGSELLNITFDPTVAQEVASYAYDDEGSEATREYLIRDGILMRPLGGATSQARAGLGGVANERACSWNRPPIDRMSNINLEPGEGTLADLVGRVERGVYMESNRSWSIDDSRNKFQFGCEYAREIKDGRLGRVLRNPNYRGISAEFWRSLKGVGGRETWEVAGTPYCGKGEPNQAIKVGHATPPCLFGAVDVFGGH
ncbi:MAG: TldD/PmbA family protein [Alphaproteobacteria bacterium]|nr:TldD/PmbA family protein [Alphaproteobacteria bacterium]